MHTGENNGCETIWVVVVVVGGGGGGGGGVFCPN